MIMIANIFSQYHLWWYYADMTMMIMIMNTTRMIIIIKTTIMTTRTTKMAVMMMRMRMRTRMITTWTTKMRMVMRTRSRPRLVLGPPPFCMKHSWCHCERPAVYQNTMMLMLNSMMMMKVSPPKYSVFSEILSVFHQNRRNTVQTAFLLLSVILNRQKSNGWAQKLLELKHGLELKRVG